MIDNEMVGGSNTHLNKTSDNKVINSTKTSRPDKSMVIDWISFTFDNVMYDENFNTSTFKNEYSLSYSKTNDYILNGLLKIFNINKPWQVLEIEDYALNGYRFSWLIGEHIKVNFAGPQSGRLVPTTQILLSGQACREFEKYFGGKYFVLFDFLTKSHEELQFRKLNGHFTRFDIAIDDYTGKEFDIYDHKSYAEFFHWSGSYRTIDIRYGAKKTGNISTTGYSATFGSPKSNQYQQYDKKLEQESKNKMFIGSDVWYRHEMRFVKPKSDKVVKLYMQNYINRTLNIFAFQLLKSCIDFKIVSKDSKKDRLPTLPSWDKFCNYVKKIDLKQDLPSEASFEKKQTWFEKNLSTSMTQLLMLYGSDFVDYIIEIAEKGSTKINEKQILQIERFIESKGKTPLPNHLLNKVKKKGLKVDYEEFIKN